MTGIAKNTDSFCQYVTISDAIAALGHRNWVTFCRRGKKLSY